MDILAVDVLGNTVTQWGIAAAVSTITAAALGVAKRVVRTRLTNWTARTERKFNDVVGDVLNATHAWFILAIGLLAGVETITLPMRVTTLLGRAVGLAVILQAGIWANVAISGWVTAYMQDRTRVDATAATTAAILSFVARVVLWSLAILMILDNFGINVTALVASLGIGGVAVALALQNILGDIFASLAIALDKPVVIGDFIVVGEMVGTVERVGLKTTHLRSLSGELIVFPNSDLLGSRIRNYKRMYERRVLFGFGVTYETDPARLRRIPVKIREIIEKESPVRFDRAHLSGFGASALEFEVVYFVKDPDYNRYMDIQQRIYLALIDELNADRVEFAYPTQTIHLATSEGVGS